MNGQTIKMLDEIPDQDNFSEFALSWRLSEKYFANKHLLAHLHPVPANLCEDIERFSNTFRSRGPYVLRDDNYFVVSEVSLEEETTQDEDRIIQWLHGLGIDPFEKVYINWLSTSGAIMTTDWETFVQVWNDLWYPFDAVDVFTQSLEWAILFGPEEIAVYVEKIR